MTDPVSADTVEQVSGWQPIETAPVHRNVLLVSRRFPEVHEGRNYGGDEGWATYGVNGVFRDDPTHWMPLPAPPRHL